MGFIGPFEDNVTPKTYKVMTVRHPLERLLSAYIYIFHTEVDKDKNGTNLYSNLTRDGSIPRMLTFQLSCVDSLQLNRVVRSFVQA